jgi:hypothetical protein
MTAWVSVGVKRESETPLLHLSLILPLRYCSPCLRHLFYPAPQSSATAGGKTFVPAIWNHHSVAPSVLWHADPHKHILGHMDARQLISEKTK